MKCTRCKKPLSRGYYYNGIVYGPECIKKVAGRSVRLHKLKVYIPQKLTNDDDDLQIDLFGDEQ